MASRWPSVVLLVLLAGCAAPTAPSFSVSEPILEASDPVLLWEVDDPPIWSMSLSARGMGETHKESTFHLRYHGLQAIRGPHGLPVTTQVYTATGPNPFKWTSAAVDAASGLPVALTDRQGIMWFLFSLQNLAPFLFLQVERAGGDLDARLLQMIPGTLALRFEKGVETEQEGFPNDDGCKLWHASLVVQGELAASLGVVWSGEIATFCLAPGEVVPRWWISNGIVMTRTSAHPDVVALTDNLPNRSRSAFAYWSRIGDPQGIVAPPGEGALAAQRRHLVEDAASTPAYRAFAAQEGPGTLWSATFTSPGMCGERESAQVVVQGTEHLHTMNLWRGPADIWHSHPAEPLGTSSARAMDRDLRITLTNASHLDQAVELLLRGPPDHWQWIHPYAWFLPLGDWVVVSGACNGPATALLFHSTFDGAIALAKVDGVDVSSLAIPSPFSCRTSPGAGHAELLAGPFCLEQVAGVGAQDA